MKKNNYCRYFRFLKNDTAVNEVSTNDFKPLVKFQHIAATTYSLVTKRPLYFGFISRKRAMGMAKAGALEHINALIAKGKDGELALYEYRFHHFQDLTVNLVEANIHEAGPALQITGLKKKFK